MTTRSNTQETAWSGEFGRVYTDRNSRSAEELDAQFASRMGVSRAELNSRFLGDLDRNMRVLEVGCNIGVQLALLKNMGFQNLYGIELQWYAVEKAKSRTTGVNILQGSGFDLPFKDEWFDLVYTSGVLIHISPENLPTIMDEICRCSRRYVWGYEYYAPQYTEMPYRGNSDLLWKGDFAAIYRQRCPSLQLRKQELVKYLADDNQDSMFLLEKA